MSVVSEVVLPLVFAVAGVALIWFLVELVMFLRRTRTTVDAVEAQAMPILKDVKEITESIKPAVDKVDPLVERVSLAVDAANLEIMRLDGILENVDKIAETTASAANAVDTVANTPLRLVNSATEKLRSALSARKASDQSASLGASVESSSAAPSEEAIGAEDAAPAFAEDSSAGERDVSARCETHSAFADGDTPDTQDAEQYFTYASKEE